MPLELKWHIFNWNPCKGEQPLQGMKLKEKELQKAKVCARNVPVWSLGTNWEFLSFGTGGSGVGDLLCRSPEGFGANPRKIFGYLTIIRP